MNKNCLLELLADGPVIAAVKNEAGLCAALESNVPVLFLLYGDLLNIGPLTRRIQAVGKAAFVHLDLIEGLAAREVSVDFISANTDAAGVISTKPQLIRRARELDLVAIQRFFLLDSMALQNIEKHLVQDCPDLIEVLPGLMPGVIRHLTQMTDSPIIAGGLIEHKDDVLSALAAGAVAVSTTNPDVWVM